MIYVCSDIHGMYDRYRKMLDTIQLTESDTLYILGDVIDRSEDGIRILMDMRTHKNIVPFIGNHELFMLFSLAEKETEPNYLEWEDSHYTRNWFSSGNGGRVTYKHFMELSEADQALLLDYIRSSYIQKIVTVNGQKYCLCHSSYMGAPDDFTISLKYNKDPLTIPEHIHLEDILFNPETMTIDSPEGKTLFNAVWYSPLRPKYNFDLPWNVFTCFTDTIFIAGHVPVQNVNTRGIYQKDNYIDIDGGCAIAPFPQYGGRKACSLLCLRLDDMEVFSIQ